MIKTREQYMNAFIAKARPHFAKIGAPIPERVRASIGFTSKGLRGKRIGECWDSLASGDATFEMFIVPSIDDPQRICGILTHELIHAAVGLEAGHGPAFRKVAVALGLEGKMTATTEGEKWHAWANPIIAKLGDLPHSKLTGNSTGKKKQTTRMIKLSCECGFTCRTARSNIVDDMICPTQCGGELMEG